MRRMLLFGVFVLCGCDAQPSGPPPSLSDPEGRVKHFIGPMGNLGAVVMYDGELRIGFTVGSNLTDGLTRASARHDLTRILRGVKEAGIDYSAVTVAADCSLVDAYGNSGMTEVVRATYKRATVDRVNWDRFLPDNIYKVADSATLHPLFQK